ncbi:bifunctional diguanylate cyclase/phosphodiesterase [Sphingomonas bacterium]|uniref:sensor domain-containing protein n=1 Tax=Sphingomonas bacterium TaxID=1895847 RepID=UPI00157682D8|nr:PAS domain S-box protein [Sphingomonas bacterium]
MESLIRAADAGRHDVCAFRMLDLLPGLVSYVTPDLVCRYANARHREWFGRSAADIVGRPLSTLIAAKAWPMIEVRLARALAGERIDFEETVDVGTGQTMVQGSYIPDRGGDGQVRGVVGMVSLPSIRKDLRARLNESQALFDTAFGTAPIGMTLITPQGRFQRLNLAMATMLGRDEADLIGRHFADLTHPDDVAVSRARFDSAMIDRTGGYRLDKRYRHADGGTVHVRLAVSIVRDADGRPLHCLTQVDDISDRHRAERALRDRNATLSRAMDAISGGYWRIDTGTGCFALSTQLAEYVGVSPDASLADYIERVLPEDRTETDLSTLLLPGSERSSGEYRIRTARGLRWVRSDRTVVYGPAGELREIVGVVVDVTDQRERLARAEANAITDPLTGALNRRGLPRRFAPGSHALLGVAVIDLDGFKAINDRHGHAVGDAVLVEVVRRLKGLGKGRVVRLGGDEFALIAERADDAAIALIRRRIERAMARPFVVAGLTLTISASVGVASTVDGSIDVDALIRVADGHVYRVKRRTD